LSKTDVVVAAVGESSVEVVSQRAEVVCRCRPGWSWVVGVDAVGGPPHRDFTNDGEVRATCPAAPTQAAYRPGRRDLDPIGEVGNYFALKKSRRVEGWNWL
jgi:hypothetical protein